MKRALMMILVPLLMQTGFAQQEKTTKFKNSKRRLPKKS